MNVMFLVFLAILDLNSHGHYELSLYGEYLFDETEKKGAIWWVNSNSLLFLGFLSICLGLHVCQSIFSHSCACVCSTAPLASLKLIQAKWTNLRSITRGQCDKRLCQARPLWPWLAERKHHISPCTSEPLNVFPWPFSGYRKPFGTFTACQCCFVLLRNDLTTHLWLAFVL